MITLTIDGTPVSVAEGTNLVEAAAAAGIEIPTYCYHPGLTVVGQCRICFVEVEGMPRLVTGCSTPAQEGMAVLTASERVREARAAVMEFLLENHPLDCPVCDQAGECGLQDYSVEHGLDTTHMVDERRTYPGLERRMIGPHVVQNQNRCIHCTRCIRFTTEISETSDLTMKSRGNHSYIDTFDSLPLGQPVVRVRRRCVPGGRADGQGVSLPGQGLAPRGNAQPSAPVAALDAMSTSATSTGSFTVSLRERTSRSTVGGCATTAGFSPTDSTTARSNARSSEVTAGQRAVAWPAALEKLADELKNAPKPIVVASANLTNEALFALKRNLVDGAHMEVIVPIHGGQKRQMKNGRDEWIESIDAHTNSSGARHLGLAMVDGASLEAYFRDANGPFLVLDAHAHPWLESEAAAAAVAGRFVAVLARTRTPLVDIATLVLPSASWAETEGTVTSSTGHVQLSKRAMAPRAQARPAWEVVYGVSPSHSVSSRSGSCRRISCLPKWPPRWPRFPG